MELISPQKSASSGFTTEWRGAFGNAEVNALHAECFEHRILTDDWWSQVNRFSLGWVCARHSGKLVGFVNVAWDGGVRAWPSDTVLKRRRSVLFAFTFSPHLN